MGVVRIVAGVSSEVTAFFFVCDVTESVWANAAVVCSRGGYNAAGLNLLQKMRHSVNLFAYETVLEWQFENFVKRGT
jgi:hypothetical protein